MTRSVRPTSVPQRASRAWACTALAAVALLGPACSDDAGTPTPDAQDVDTVDAVDVAQDAADALAPDADASSPDAAPDGGDVDDADPHDGSPTPEPGPDDTSSDVPTPDDADVDEEDPDAWPPARPGCNGHEALCDRPYDQVLFPGTHNAMSNREDRWILPNQNRNLRNQLRDGIRVLLLDVYDQNGEILLCHSICAAGRRPFLDAMNELRSFLDANPGEVVTLILEDYVTAEQIEEVMEAAGLVERAWTQTIGEPWPTLREMVDAGRTLVVTAQSRRPPPAWLHNIWQHGWDTPFTFSSVDDFTCRANRGDSSHPLFLVNHWILNPAASPDHARLANPREVLLERIETCRDQWDRLPTFLAVDFYEIGDLFDVVDELNQVGAFAPPAE